MAGDAEWGELGDEIKVYGSWAVSSLVDGVFLIIWAIVQWLVNQVIGNFFQPKGLDQGVFLVFQVLFAVSTLVPVVVYVYTDTRIRVLRARRRIQLEMERSRRDDSNDQ